MNGYKWISFSERMPTREDCIHSDNHVWVKDVNGWNYLMWFHHNFIGMGKFTHWQPIKPPEQ